MIVWNDAQYPGNHEAIITPESFEKVQDILRERTGGKTRHRVHDHYLRGSVFCLACGSRLTTGVSRGNGGTYSHFFCLGRHTHGNGCTEPYTATSDVEFGIESLWWRVKLLPAAKDEIRRDVEHEVRVRMNDWAPRVTAAVRRIEELRKERERLLAAYLAEAVPVEQLKAEQDRIGSEMRALEEQTAKPQAQGDRVERMLDRAFGYLDNLRDAYLSASGRTRRAWNQLVFKGFWVGDRQVRRYEFTDLFHDVVEYDGSSKTNLVGRGGLEPPTSAVSGPER